MIIVFEEPSDGVKLTEDFFISKIGIKVNYKSNKWNIKNKNFWFSF